MQHTLLFVVPSAYPLGGVAVWLNYIIQGLSSLGWRIHIGLVNGEYHQAVNYLSEYSFENVEVIDNPTKTRFGRIAAISKVIQHTNADLVLSVNIPDVFDAVASCKRKGQQVKSAMTLHGLEADYFQDIATFKEKIDAVISTNMLTYSMLLEYSKFSEERTFYAPYGVNVKLGLERKNRTGKLVLLYAGRIVENQKRCQHLLLMVQEMECRGLEYEFLIAGDGPDRERLINEMDAAANVGRVNYLGQLSNQQFIKEVLPKADVLVLVSQWETGPIIIWEAMAAGLTILSSRYIGSGLEQALKNNKNCLLFDIGDISSAVDHLERLIELDMTDGLKKEALNLIESRYSLEASIRSWDLTLHNIINEVAAKPSVEVDTQSWPLNGRLEKVLGHKFASWLRHIADIPAYTDSAGDEWPHSYGYVDDSEYEKFIKTMHSLDS